jgi:hypothetical protein
VLTSAYNKMSRNYIVRLGPLKNVQYKNITPLFRTVHAALRLEREHYKYGCFALAQRDLRNWYHDVKILRHIFVSDALTSPSVLYQGDMYRQPIVIGSRNAT